MFARTANATFNNVNYNTQRIAELAANGFAVDMTDSYDLFVNGNAVNVEDCDIATFESMIKFDSVNDDGVPVLVYMQEGNMIAWYDEENAYGYIDC